MQEIGSVDIEKLLASCDQESTDDYGMLHTCSGTYCMYSFC